ncbi:ethanolamine utilization protein EutJ [Bacillus sp. Soil745]|jgi:branched-chain amino acid transport system substrate-binding protein|uniref:ABC transporter substrate-binding protein n=1 Tax=Peribacillus TaxID=2675229 RepID=UPI00070D32B0|nr:MULTISPECIES: ABC transporter substrate-binding protein [Peribacillus]KRF54350.1 ethanolamine utilization protein EutJ [Bacillus sp. Soil745]MBD8134889.1 ABC transporter substrate-binding protein [Bacillus sp. CFBP 13597]MDP9739926.1 branched-chain amino acid transport system substrate-binding protein [Bacillus sp. B2I3]PAW30049.1 ethanolamine utilization protein EutJ [Peribacillus simplex]PEF36865.1 ethanolamine utilization protein EutJ [Bacillus sp. AFS094228]PEO44598.1 ethanolamine util
MKKKKLAGVFLSLSLVAGALAGCSGDSKTSSSSGGSSKSGDTIKIGANLELSGGTASFGQSAADGLKLAIDEINKEGIDGKKLEIVKVDNKSDAAEATSGSIKLVSQDKVVAVVGSATSTNTLAQVQVAQDNKVPLLTPTATNPDITNKAGKLNDYVFRTCFIDPFQGTVAANFASDEIGAKTAAIYVDSASDYSKGLAAAFKEAFTAKGGKIVAEEAYVTKDTDFRSTLTRIKSAKPEFVFLPGYYEEVGLILKQAREDGIDLPFMGGDGWDSPKVVEIAGAEALKNTYITNHYSPEDEDAKIQDFVAAFKKEYDKTPDAFAALGYDTGYYLADAIKRSGDASPEKIRQALEDVKDLQLVSGTLNLDENHDPIKSATILEYVDGKQTFKTKINP